MYSNRTEYPFPNAVICDLRYGDESGIDFLGWIRSVDEDCKTLPVYILTKRFSLDDATAAKKMGATEIIKNPLSGEEFQNMLVDLASKLCS